MTTCITDFLDFPFSITQDSREKDHKEGYYRIYPVGSYIFPPSPSDKGPPTKYGSPLIRYQSTSQTCYSEPHKNRKGAALASITLLPSVIGVISGKALVASFIEHIGSNGETWEYRWGNKCKWNRAFPQAHMLTIECLE